MTAGSGSLALERRKMSVSEQTQAGAGRTGRRRPPRTPKGRQVDPVALEEVQALLTDRPRKRDLLIEHLHLIQDHYGYISAAHLAALAAEMKMAQTEVYEVATFYSHFDVVKDGVPPPPVTVRVCDSLSCAMAGAEKLLKELPGKLGKDVRVVRAPCMGACDRAPVCAVGHLQTFKATPDKVVADAKAHKHPHAWKPATDFAAYQKAGGYALLNDCLAGKRTRDELIKIVSDAGLRGLGGAGFPTGRKWQLVRAEPAPRLFAVNGDEGEPGTFKDRYYLEQDPHRFIEGMLIAAWVVEAPETYFYIRDEYPELRLMIAQEFEQGRKGRPVAAHQAASAPRRRRLHLRRRIGDDRIDRGQARPAAPPPALRRAGRPVRPPDAGAERRDPVLDARHRGEGRRVDDQPGPQGAQGLPQLLGVRPGEKAGRGGGAGRRHRARIDRGILRRHGRRPHASRAICPAAPPAASCRRRWRTSRWTSEPWRNSAASSVRTRLSSCPTRTI